MGLKKTADALLLLTALLLAGCGAPPAVAPRPAAPAAAAVAIERNDPLLDDVEHRSFQYFWDLADAHTLLIPDRAPTPSFSSIAAVGFGLTAYGIGAERGYITREAARERVATTLKFFAAP